MQAKATVARLRIRKCLTDAFDALPPSRPGYGLVGPSLASAPCFAQPSAPQHAAALPLAPSHASSRQPGAWPAQPSSMEVDHLSGCLAHHSGLPGACLDAMQQRQASHAAASVCWAVNESPPGAVEVRIDGPGCTPFPEIKNQRALADVSNLASQLRGSLQMRSPALKGGCPPHLVRKG